MKPVSRFLLGLLLLSAAMACNNAKTDGHDGGDRGDSTATGATAATEDAGGRYKAGDFLHVFARSGLVLREKPDIKAPKVASMAIGERLEVTDEEPFQHAFSVKEPCGLEIKGFWVKAKYGRKEGYVFDGYLLPYPPPLEISMSDYWSGEHKVVSSTDKPPVNDVSYYAYSKTIWDNGVSYESSGYEGGDNDVLTFPKAGFSFQEVYLFATARHENDPDIQRSCNCDGVKETLTCDSADELSRMEIDKDAEGNFFVRNSYAD